MTRSWGTSQKLWEHTEDSELFLKRAQNYRNVIDPQTGFARGRHANGSWDSPFDPTVQYHYITEGLPFQYTFFVPQDLGGLIDLVGGRQKFIGKLDALFDGGPAIMSPENGTRRTYPVQS